MGRARVPDRFIQVYAVGSFIFMWVKLLRHAVPCPQSFCLVYVVVLLVLAHGQGKRRQVVQFLVWAFSPSLWAGQGFQTGSFRCTQWVVHLHVGQAAPPCFAAYFDSVIYQAAWGARVRVVIWGIS